MHLAPLLKRFKGSPELLLVPGPAPKVGTNRTENQQRRQLVLAPAGYGVRVGYVYTDGSMSTTRKHVPNGSTSARFEGRWCHTISWPTPCRP